MTSTRNLSATLTTYAYHITFLYQHLLTPGKLSNILAELAANPSVEILDSLRGLERKTATVFTLLKASVYSIVLQQEIRDEDGGTPRG